MYMVAFVAFALWICAFDATLASKVAVFGASGGVGQQICRTLLNNNFEVTATSRDITKLDSADATFELLKGCDYVQADARIPETIPSAIEGANSIIISVGTTAFPTSKWKNGNDPKAACFDTVNNILNAIAGLEIKPENVVLLSSIGAERVDKIPYKILNSYGVLDEKRNSEVLLFERAKELGFRPIVCRPGRLVGAPFTNFDLAKLFNIDQGSNKGIILDTRDVLDGDVERADVAESIMRLLCASLPNKDPIMYSIINKPGDTPTDMQWGTLLSLFTVSQEDMLTSRST
jgi:nucleoside-diphosphate-sugar epimerase